MDKIKPYSEKLKDPRWQRKRLEVLQKADFKCQLCGDGKKTLHVHHSKYDGREPWEYPLNILICLCEHCHNQHHKGSKSQAEQLVAKLAAALKSKETREIRIHRTGLKQPQKSALLRKQVELRGEPPLKWEDWRKTMDCRQHINHAPKTLKEWRESGATYTGIKNQLNGAGGPFPAQETA